MKRSQTIGSDNRPILDDVVLEAIITGLTRGRAQSFVDRALALASRTLRDFETNNLNVRECEQIAHRLKGSAANVGLARIALEVGEIENLARRGAPITALELQRLSEAIEVTRLEFDHRFRDGAADKEGGRHPHRRSTVSANK